jgi:formylglycine-generating enzyme required for sulfatase activity
MNDPAGATGGRTLATTDKIISDSFAFATDGTIINGTGSAGAPALEWSADDPAGYVDWATAGAYCTGLGGGYRLPHLWELLQYFQQNGQGSFQSDFYWSSTEYPDYPDGAYNVGMFDGSVGFNVKSSPDILARCAR